MARRTDPSNPQRDRYGSDDGRLEQERSDRWRRGGRGGGNGSAPAHRADRDDATDRPDFSIDEVVERLSRDVGDAPDVSPLDEGDDVRTYARELLREDTEHPTAPQPTRRARLSFFAVALWLAVAGAVLSFIVPPAGVVCFFMAGVAAVLAAILGPGESRPDKTTEPGRNPDYP